MDRARLVLAQHGIKVEIKIVTPEEAYERSPGGVQVRTLKNNMVRVFGSETTKRQSVSESIIYVFSGNPEL